jgi:psp operon transcriptional activator
MAELAKSPDLPPLLGQSPAFQEMLAHVSRLAPLERPVLVLGERGTGKELVAARLNFLSARWEKPFVKLNCAALAESLLDSELFGHEAGAFTGAARRRLSRFELANGGTLFLDEIATASLAVQEKILRVIEYGVFERVGGNETIEVDVRIVAATNADLPGLAASGKFRADLLDRLAFDVVRVPPLRERPEDIPVLAEHFGRLMARELGRDAFPGFTPAAAAGLAAYAWPGNVRELKNIAERSVARAARPDRPVDDVVFDPFGSATRAMAPVSSPASAPVASRDLSTDFLGDVRTYEIGILEAALAANRFNQQRTAKALGLTYHQLRHYLKKHELPRAADLPPPPQGGRGK